MELPKLKNNKWQIKSNGEYFYIGCRMPHVLGFLQILTPIQINYVLLHWKALEDAHNKRCLIKYQPVQ